MTCMRRGWKLMNSRTSIQNDNNVLHTHSHLSNVHTWVNEADTCHDGYYETYTKEGERTDGIYIDNAQTPDGRPIFNENGYEAFAPYSHLLGYSDPDWIYGWQNNFKYKNFSLS